MESDFDITRVRVIETDEDSLLSVHPLGCNITYPPIPTQSSKDNTTICCKKKKAHTCCALKVETVGLFEMFI